MVGGGICRFKSHVLSYCQTDYAEARDRFDAVFLPEHAAGQGAPLDSVCMAAVFLFQYLRGGVPLERIHPAQTGASQRKDDMVRTRDFLVGMAYSHGAGSGDDRNSDTVHSAGDRADQEEYDDIACRSCGIRRVRISGAGTRRGALKGDRENTAIEDDEQR